MRLVELIVVVVIIVMLSGIVAPMYYKSKTELSRYGFLYIEHPYASVSYVRVRAKEPVSSNIFGGLPAHTEVYGRGRMAPSGKWVWSPEPIPELEGE